jgi:hypothetical protein
MVCVDDCRPTMAVVIDVAAREIPGATSVTAIQIHFGKPSLRVAISCW